MPIYEYKCKKCNYNFEQLMFSSRESAPKCPECRCDDVDKLISAGFSRPYGIPTGSGGFKAPSCKPSGSG